MTHNKIYLYIIMRHILKNCLRTFTTIKHTIGYDYTLSARQLCDLECIIDGSFSPLKTFLNKDDYDNVLKNNRLSTGELWPMPITLDFTQQKLEDYKKSGHEKICLRDNEFNILATIMPLEIWKPDKIKEASSVFGGDEEHPAIKQLFKSGNYYISGPLEIHQSPVHYDYLNLRQSPTQLKKILPKNIPIVGFQTRNPMHRAHMELVGQATKSVNGIALIHPVVGLTKPGDIDYHTRIKCYQEVIKKGNLHTQAGDIKTILSLLPLAMRMGGPREALWHALIRQNYGCTHFICGRDHAGPGSNSKGVDFYSPYEARDFLQNFQNELNIKIISFDMMVYLKDKKKYYPITKLKKTEEVLKLSGTEVRNRLKNGKDIPEWFSPPEVVNILRKVHPIKKNQGFTLFFTGLSGSGKSTIANGLLERLHAETFKSITVLDGDDVRRFLSSELGFSKEHRDLNITRIGYVASEINKSGGVAICAAIAPFKNTRQDVRELVENKGGNFIEIFIDANLNSCEKRDRKGLYKKARDGLVKDFTGIDSPYEVPSNAEIVIKTDLLPINESVNLIMEYLKDTRLI